MIRALQKRGKAALIGRAQKAESRKELREDDDRRNGRSENREHKKKKNFVMGTLNLLFSIFTKYFVSVNNVQLTLNSLMVVELIKNYC